MTRVPRWKVVSSVVALLFSLLALAASTGITPCLVVPISLVLVAYLVLLCSGYAAGATSIRRRIEIDAERWQIVQQDGLTSGERQLAHREADRQSRIASALLFAAAVAPGAWLSYQLRDPEIFTKSDLLILAPVLGFVMGMVVTHHRLPSRFERS